MAETRLPSRSSTVTVSPRLLWDRLPLRLRMHRAWSSVRPSPCFVLALVDVRDVGEITSTPKTVKLLELAPVLLLSIMLLAPIALDYQRVPRRIEMNHHVQSQ